MRILGLDVGSKTIGVAISDPLGWTAQGIDTIRRKINAIFLIKLTLTYLLIPHRGVIITQGDDNI